MINFAPQVATYFYNYINIFVFLVFAVIISLVLYFVSLVISFPLITKESEKISTYECGFVPFGDSRMKFDVSFYIISILFVIFDLEIVFLFPWSVCLPDIGILGSVSMIYFFIILGVGFVFEWSKGALEI